VFRSLSVWIIATASFAATLTDDRIAQVVKRLEVLSAKESAGPRADTRRRQSELLRGVPTPPAASLTPAQPSCSAPAGLDEAARVLFIEDALAFIRTLQNNDQQVPLTELLDCVEDFRLDREVLESVAKQFLYIVEHTTEAPAGYERLSRMRRQYELSVGSDNASVRARDALAELAALMSTEYDFALASLSGRNITLKQQRGRVVVLTFWATWCAPCINEMPVFEKLYREHRNDAFELLAVSDEPAGIVQAFMKEHGYTFPVVLDPSHIVFDHYRIQGMPATRIIDKTGRLRAESGAITETELNQLLPIAGLSVVRSQLGMTGR
jgi:peroxiredoxin